MDRSDRLCEMLMREYWVIKSKRNCRYHLSTAPHPSFHLQYSEGGHRLPPPAKRIVVARVVDDDSASRVLLGNVRDVDFVAHHWVA